MTDYLKKYGYMPDKEAIDRALDMVAANIDNVISQKVLKDCFSMMDLTSLRTEDTVESVSKLVEKVNAFHKNFPEYPLPCEIVRKRIRGILRLIRPCRAPAGWSERYRPTGCLPRKPAARKCRWQWPAWEGRRKIRLLSIWRQRSPLRQGQLRSFRRPFGLRRSGVRAHPWKRLRPVRPAALRLVQSRICTEKGRRPWRWKSAFPRGMSAESDSMLHLSAADTDLRCRDPLRGSGENTKCSRQSSPP